MLKVFLQTFSCLYLCPYDSFQIRINTVKKNQHVIVLINPIVGQVLKTGVILGLLHFRQSSQRRFTDVHMTLLLQIKPAASLQVKIILWNGSLQFFLPDGGLEGQKDHNSLSECISFGFSCSGIDQRSTLWFLEGQLSHEEAQPAGSGLGDVSHVVTAETRWGLRRKQHFRQVAAHHIILSCLNSHCM